VFVETKSVVSFPARLVGTAALFSSGVKGAHDRGSERIIL
jgi:hypothetical protein